MRQRRIIRKGQLLLDNRENPIIKEGQKALTKNGYDPEDIAYYAERIVSVLNDYAQHFGVNTPFEYIIGRRFGRMEVNILIPGDRFDPFEFGEGSKRRRIEKLLNLNLSSQEPAINYSYVLGRNVITGLVPLVKKKKSILTDPTAWAVFLGVIVGLICLKLPEEMNRFIVNDVMDSLYSVILKVLSGIMGPVLFISLTTSIISLDSVNDLTHMGFVILRRSLRIIFFFIAVSLGISLLFFGKFGQGKYDFSPSQIVSMLLNIIPVNVFKPFLENNTPQLVVLAFVAGLGFLLMRERAKELQGIIQQVNSWFLSIMKIVNRILPAVPFLAIAVTIGKGEAGSMLQGWKFILASYLIFSLCLAVKIIKTGIVTKMSGVEILRRSRPAILTALATQSTTAALPQIYEISRDKLNIKPEFTSFWIPLYSAITSLKTTVNVVLGVIMMSQLMGSPISLSFLIVLVILTTEMSLASPGTVGSWVIAFEAFSMPAGQVGLLSTYRMLTANFATGVVMAYQMLEEVEAAYKLDGRIPSAEDGEEAAPAAAES